MMLERFLAPDGRLCLARSIQAFFTKRTKLERAFLAYASLILAAHEYGQEKASTHAAATRRLASVARAARGLMNTALACLPPQIGDMHGQAIECLAALGREIIKASER